MLPWSPPAPRWMPTAEEHLPLQAGISTMFTVTLCPSSFDSVALAGWNLTDGVFIDNSLTLQPIQVYECKAAPLSIPTYVSQRIT